MKLSGFVIALLFIVAAVLSIFTFVFDVYSPSGYNINLSDDENTKVIGEMQTEFIDQRTQLDSTGARVFNGTVGQPGADLPSGEVTEGAIIASSARAVTNIPSYLNSFIKIIFELANAVGLGGIPAVWWIVTSIIILISFLLIGIFVKQAI